MKQHQLIRRIKQTLRSLAVDAEEASDSPDDKEACEEFITVLSDQAGALKKLVGKLEESK